MKKALKIASAGLIAGTALMLTTSFAMAHDRGGVSWSISVGTPYPAPIYSPPPVVYVQPEPVYIQPQPVYVRPRPVYVERAPLVEYRSYYPQPVYVEGARYHRRHHGRHHYGD
jgi:hypothetical protein